MKRLYRDKSNEMIAGVCSGIAEYLDVDATIIRLVFVLFAFLGGGGLWIYLVLWIIMPEKPVTLSEVVEVQEKAAPIKEAKDRKKEPAKKTTATKTPTKKSTPAAKPSTKKPTTPAAKKSTSTKTKRSTTPKPESAPKEDDTENKKE